MVEEINIKKELEALPQNEKRFGGKAGLKNLKRPWHGGRRDNNFSIRKPGCARASGKKSNHFREQGNDVQTR